MNTRYNFFLSPPLHLFQRVGNHLQTCLRNIRFSGHLVVVILTSTPKPRGFNPSLTVGYPTKKSGITVFCGKPY